MVRSTWIVAPIFRPDHADLPPLWNPERLFALKKYAVKPGKRRLTYGRVHFEKITCRCRLGKKYLIFLGNILLQARILRIVNDQVTSNKSLAGHA